MMVCLVFATLIHCLNGSAWGQTTWTGAGGDLLWSNSANWSGTALPVATGTALFSSGTGTVTLNSIQSINIVQFDGFADSFNLQGGTINLTSGGSIKVNGTSGGPLNSIFNINSSISLNGGLNSIGNYRTAASLSSGFLATINVNGNIFAANASTSTIEFAGNSGGSGSVYSGTTFVNGVISDGTAGGKVIVSVGDPASTTVAPLSVWLTGTNSYSGGTQIRWGVLGAQSLAALGNFSTTGTLSIETGGLSGGVYGVEILGTGGTAAGTVNLAYAGTTTGVVNFIDYSGTGLLNFTRALSVSGTAARVFQLQGSNTTGTGCFSGAIGDGSAVISLAKAGAGTWILMGTNTYSGATSVTGGVLNLQTSTALGTGTATVSTGAAIQLQSGSGITVGNALILNDSDINNSGDLRSVSGSNTYSGPITLANSARINADADALYLNGGTISLGSYTLTLGGGGNLAVNSILSGNGGLTKDGPGILTLTGSNAFTGPTIVSSGTLSIGDGKLGHDGSIAASSGITLSNTSSSLVYNLSSTASRTYSNVITGQGSLKVTGSGSLTLNAINTFTGPVLVTSGSLILSNTGALGAAAIDTSSAPNSITLASATPTFGGITGTGAGGFSSIFSTAPTALTLNPSAGVSNSTSSIIDGALNLTKTGSGTQILNGLNSYTGVTTISNGVLSVSNLANSGTASGIGTSGSLVFSGSLATLQYTGATTSVNLSATCSNLPSQSNSYFGIDVANASTSLTWSGSIIGGTSNILSYFNKSGSGTFIMTGSEAVSYMNVFAGTVNWSKSNITYPWIYQGGTLVLGMASNITQISQIDGTLDLNGISTNNLVRINTASITGTAHTGLITNGSSNTTAVLNVSGNGSGNTELYANIQDGAGKVAVTTAGGANIQLSGTNLYSGTTTVNGAFGIYANSNTAFSPNSDFLLKGNGNGISLSNTNNAASYDNAIGSLSGTATSIVALGNNTLTTGGKGTNTVFAGDITGAGNLTKAGTSTMILTGSNSYTGVTTISGGVLQIGAGTGGNDGSVASSSSIVNNASLVYNLSSTATRTYGNIISGTGSLTKSGSGTLTLNGANTFTGNTVVTSGSLTVSGSLSLTGSVSVGSAGTLNVSGLVNNAALITIDGILRGHGSVGSVNVLSNGVLAPGDSAPGILHLSAAPTFSGSTANLSIQIGKTTTGLAVAGTDYSQLSIAAGTLNLNNVKLILAGGATNLQTGDLLFIVANGGASLINGTFYGLAQDAIFAPAGFGGTLFQISYTANALGNSFSGTGYDIALQVVPEPGSWAMLLGGAGMLARMVRRRRRQ